MFITEILSNERVCIRSKSASDNRLQVRFTLKSDVLLPIAILL